MKGQVEGAQEELSAALASLSRSSHPIDPSVSFSLPLSSSLSLSPFLPPSLRLSLSPTLFLARCLTPPSLSARSVCVCV
eukprot:1801344-Rhodomonas_salina.1